MELLYHPITAEILFFRWTPLAIRMLGWFLFRTEHDVTKGHESLAPAQRKLTRIYWYFSAVPDRLILAHGNNKGEFMDSPIRRFSVGGVIILAGIVVLSGCASRKYVRLQTQGLEPAIQEANNAAKENAERIDAVDRRAQQGITAAGAADQRAAAAQKAADAASQAAQAADRKADTANQGIQQANNRINTLETSVKSININDTYTESDKQAVTFAVNSSTLNDQAKGTLDRIVSNLSGLRTGYMVEIQGFTDSTGSEQFNIGLSQRRAQSVERYLVTKSIPLYRISIVGLGEDNPIADNKTSQGRSQNRRVEVRVLRTTSGRTTN
jgi:outer membrane protein OmpA-like peptidoglycan-associated protein